MPGKSKETIIISLGGSMVAPGEIDLIFLKNFKRCLQKYFKDIFFIFVGGGKVARNYQKALSEFGAKDVGKDRIGINVSRLNAEVVKQAFAEFSYPGIIIDPTKKIRGIGSRRIAIGAGWKIF